MPRDVRTAQESATTGNRTWSMFVSLPVDVADPAERLARIVDHTASAKQRASSAGNAGFRFDVAATNVRLGGPHEIGGGRIRSIHATAPLQGDNRLLVLAMSHDDELTLSFFADADAFPDLDTLADGAVAGFHHRCPRGAGVVPR